jgi:hypothetical protein
MSMSEGKEIEKEEKKYNPGKKDDEVSKLIK